MITNEDIKKLKRVFVTKEDLKKELRVFATKDDIKVFVTKRDFQSAMEELVGLITSGFSRMDKAIARLDEHSDILNNHEHRLDKIEDKVFATT